MKNFWQKLPTPFFILAPMDGVTDTVFRHIVKSAASPDAFFSEFTNATSYANPKGRHSTISRLQFSTDEQPMVAQIWGTNPDDYRLMAKDIAAMGYAGIDINMGCPTKDVVKTGACSALIENPTLAAELIAAAKESGLPVSVKTRIGFRERKTEEWLSFLLNQDLAALTVHARTAKEMSAVPAHWEEVAKAVKLRDQIAPHTKLIGNGDVVNRQQGLARIAESGADGIMIGRGIFHDVFCFETISQEHTVAERLQLLYDHLDLFDQTWVDNPQPFAPLKRFFKIYVNSFAGASELRDKLMHTNSTTEARAVLARR
jgi:tRNA-dihydrouridine synthase